MVEGRMLKVESRIHIVIGLLVGLVWLTQCQQPGRDRTAVAHDPDSAAYYREIAHKAYHSGDMDQARTAFDKIFTFDTIQYLKDVILGKRLFFIPESFTIPEWLDAGSFQLVPIGREYAAMDFEAITKSAEHLTGVLGRYDWPGEITFLEDSLALVGHEWEFEHRTGFVYTVLNPTGDAVIGCVYVYPSRLDDYDAEVVLWVTKSAYDDGLDSLLFQRVDQWLHEQWPFEKVIYPGREIQWGAFFSKLDAQDQQYH